MTADRIPLRAKRAIYQLGAAVVVVLFPVFAVAADAPAGTTEQTDVLRAELREMVAAARDRVFPALVHVHVVSVSYWDGKEQKHRSVGSGTIISPDGYVLTNQHVTDNGRKFTCTLADKQEIPAKLVGADPLTDLAVLKLDLSARKDPNAAIAVATFGDSGTLQIGDTVMAMGSPFALSRSVTLGIVSNTQRVFIGGFGSDDADDMELESGQRTGLFTRWIQHDALINPGNSGGPLVNLAGEVVGVNELGGAAMGFAIPSNLARVVADELIAHGEVRRSWIGISIKPIAKTGLTEGVLVNSVEQEGPAAKAGIEAGDIVLALNGEATNVWFPEQVPPLLKKIAEMPVGAELSVRYRRDGSEHETTITTDKLRKDIGDEAAFRAWGFTAQDITPRMARQRRLDSTDGVLITSIRDGGPAALAEPPIADGDVLRMIDGKLIGDLAGLIERYGEVMARDPLPKYLLVAFDRLGRNELTLLKPKPDEDEEPPREVPKAWIGVATQPVLKDLAEQLGDGAVQGYRIVRVYPKTAAAEADLKVGDIITALNGKELTPRGMQDAGRLGREVRKLGIGEPATLTLIRDGASHDVTVTLDRTRITRTEARRDRNRDFDLIVREITFFDRDENRWDESVKGVIVDAVESAGWAGLGGVRNGDLIQRIDEMPIRGLKSYRKAMEQIAKEQPERVIFVVLRGVRTRFQYVEPDWKPTTAENADKNATDKEPD